MTIPNKGRINKLITTALLVTNLILGGYIYFTRNAIEDYQQEANILEATLDSTRVSWNNRRGVWESERLLLQADKEMILKTLQRKEVELDVAYQRLEEYAKTDKVKTAVIVEAETKIDTVVKTVVRHRVDTVTKVVSEERLINYKDSFTNLEVRSLPDSSFIKLMSKTGLDLLVEKDGTLRAIPSNPKMVVTEIKGFNKVPKKKNTGWKYWLGAVGGSILTILIVTASTK